MLKDNEIKCAEFFNYSYRFFTIYLYIFFFHPSKVESLYVTIIHEYLS